MLGIDRCSEEHAIRDYEGFEGANLSEYASFETVCDLAEFIGAHGEFGARLYAHYGNDLQEACAAFEDYAGEYCSAADFAEELHNDTGAAIPESLGYDIDWRAPRRDMVLNGEIMVFRTGFDDVHIFLSALSRSACAARLCSVCSVHPIFPEIDIIAAHCDAYSRRCSATIRTARSRTSGK